MNKIDQNNNNKYYNKDPYYYQQPQPYTSQELQQMRNNHNLNSNQPQPYPPIQNQPISNQQIYQQHRECIDVNNNMNALPLNYKTHNQEDNNKYNETPSNENNLINTQYFNQLSHSQLDLEIKNNQSQIQLLKDENQQLNQEILQFNQNVFSDQKKYISNYSSPIYINQQNFIDDQPEIAYCSTKNANFKHQHCCNSSCGLASLLQKIHNHMNLDYSAIHIYKQANLFKDSFLENEIIQKLVKTNLYLSRETIADSKPVYCCKHLQKHLIKYSKAFCITQTIVLFVLLVVFTINQFSSDYIDTLDNTINYFYFFNLTIMVSMIFFGMRFCSLTLFKIAFAMSLVGIFLVGYITSKSILPMVAIMLGSEIKKIEIISFGVNVINMFIQIGMMIYIQNLLDGLKRLLAVVVQISSEKLLS